MIVDYRDVTVSLPVEVYEDLRAWASSAGMSAPEAAAAIVADRLDYSRT